MADPPRRHLPETTAGSLTSGCRKREENIAMFDEEGSFGVGKGAAGANEIGLHTLEEVEEMKKAFLQQMMEEIEEIDTDEEYQKEMEEQRLADDEKNGHFSEPNRPAGERLEKVNAAAGIAARVSADNLHSSSLYQDVIMDEGGNMPFEKDVNSKKGGCS